MSTDQSTMPPNQNNADMMPTESGSAPPSGPSSAGTAALVRPKPKRWVLLAVAALLIIAVGFGVWALTAKKPSKPATTVGNQTAALDKSTLRVATIIDENGLAADKQEFTPFLDYMAGQLHSQGITKAEFVPETSVSDVAELMRQGRVDLYVDSVFPVFVADRLAGSQLIADRWKEGVEKYRTAIFVKKDSPIKTVADLKGKILAFDSSTSTVGYFLPKAGLSKLGYTLAEKQKPTDTVAADQIGYEFVHDKVYDDVANGTLPAGAESEQEIRDHFGASFDSHYRIIMTTPYVLRFLVTGRKDLAPSLTTAIKSTLFAMDGTAQGKVVLKSFADTAKFTPVAADGDAAYGEVQKLTNYIEDEIVRGGVGATSQ